jgi:hypothetical protein
VGATVAGVGVKPLIAGAENTFLTGISSSVSG